MEAADKAYDKGADWAICMVLTLEPNDLSALKAKIKVGHPPSEALKAILALP
jgi:hypothetical protein